MESKDFYNFFNNLLKCYIPEHLVRYLVVLLNTLVLNFVIKIVSFFKKNTEGSEENQKHF